MPLRQIPLFTNQIYHVTNRGSGDTSIFLNANDYKKILSTFQYYQYQALPFRFSIFMNFEKEERDKLLLEIKKSKNPLVEIISFCLMPNHFHFLLKQTIDNGILNFIRLTTNSYSRYFNIKYKRKGGLFGGRFKAVRIENDEQLLHVNRYIHLNPYSSFVTKEIGDLLAYPYSSLSEYLEQKENNICQKELVTAFFKTIKEYKKFILDQADYQRSLQLIKQQLE